jgi:multicopper oxidase
MGVMTVTGLTRRQLLASAAGVAGVTVLGGCGRSGTGGIDAVTATSGAVWRAEAARMRATGGRTVTARLVAQPATIDLGGPTVRTWAYGDAVPGPLLRATAGDLLKVAVDNQLPQPTTVHWHGVALRNDMDGVPGLTQKPIQPGGQFEYAFTVPDPGTYFFHPHVGLQLDRGLYGVLVVDDPHERGDYDIEWVVVLDDWVDGTGRTPDDVLRGLVASGMGGMDGSGGMDGMAGMGHGASDPNGAEPDDAMSGMGMSGSGVAGGGSSSGGMSGIGQMGSESMTSPLLGGAGDITYPHYLLNGRVPATPATFRGRPGQRVRIRLINAGSDTAFRVALGDHRLRVTHADGWPVVPTDTDAVLVGMGERFDVEVTLGEGVFPLVAAAEGKTGAAQAVVRTATGAAPAAGARPAELTRGVLFGSDLRATAPARLPSRPVDRTHGLVLGGSMAGYRWTINGKAFPDTDPLLVTQGERVRLRFTNHSMMFHPMHVHGHTFALVGDTGSNGTAGGNGARKDTVIVRPMCTVTVELDAGNPGQWMTHCHNIYHAERCMMINLSYRA